MQSTPNRLCYYKESSKESNSSSWHSSHPFVANNKPVSSSSGSIGLTGSVNTDWFGIEAGIKSSLFFSFSILGSSDVVLLFFMFVLFFSSFSRCRASSKFSISVSPQMEMFERMLCFRSPVELDGRYLKNNICSGIQDYLNIL